MTKQIGSVEAVIRAAVDCAKAISQEKSKPVTPNPLREQLAAAVADLPSRVLAATSRRTSPEVVKRAKALTEILIACPAAASGWRQVTRELSEMRSWGDYEHVEYVVEDVLWYPYNLGAFFNSDHLVAIVELACLRLYEMRGGSSTADVERLSV
jgi:hypothetical protein